MTHAYVLVTVSVVWLSGCGARSYVPLKNQQNLNSGLAAVSVDRIDGRCTVTVAVKGDAGRYLLVAPDDMCEKAALAQAAIATVPPNKAGSVQ